MYISKNMRKSKFKKYFFNAVFERICKKEHTTPISHLPNSRPITPLSSPYSAGTASIHQNPMLTQNHQFQMDARNMKSNSNISNILSSHSPVYNYD